MAPAASLDGLINGMDDAASGALPWEREERAPVAVVSLERERAAPAVAGERSGGR